MIIESVEDVQLLQGMMQELNLHTTLNGFNLWITELHPNREQLNALEVAGASFAQKRADKNAAKGKSDPVWYFHSVHGLPRYIEGIA